MSRVWPRWREALVIVKPETVIDWHRKGFRPYWTSKSRGGKPGRRARALGLLAKSDEIDAQVIARFGQAVRPRGRVRVDGKRTELAALAARCRQVTAMIIAECNRLRRAHSLKTTSSNGSVWARSVHRQLRTFSLAHDSRVVPWRGRNPAHNNTRPARPLTWRACPSGGFFGLTRRHWRHGPSSLRGIFCAYAARYSGPRSQKMVAGAGLGDKPKLAPVATNF